MNTLLHGEYIHKTLFSFPHNPHTLVQSDLSMLTYHTSANLVHLTLPMKQKCCCGLKFFNPLTFCLKQYQGCLVPLGLHFFLCVGYT